METIAPIALKIVVLVVMVFGMFSLVIPFVPGLTIVWVAALVYGLLEGFNLTGGILFGVITALMLFGSVVDNLLMGAGAKQSGASWHAIGIALVAGVVGSLAFPPFGGLALAMIGLFVVEILRLRDWRRASDSAKSLVLGWGKAVLARIGIAALMILLWLAWAFLVP
ncbi:MAG: DUF456 domain-containing protein [Chloroflexi bacterium]|nr:DUF456 domain-containing protein [Chloroflexota bacterium]